MSLEKPVPFQDTFDSSHLLQRRIGHITSIQIRNLTPFPARDTLTSALSKPTELPAVTNGHLADDLDATFARKRTRKASTNSVVTLRSSRSDDGEQSQVFEGRKRTSSRLSERSITTGKTAPTIRPQRNRTISVASIFTDSHNTEFSRIYLPPEDYSQTGLEKVIGSRLVETFLVVTADSEQSSAESVIYGPPASPTNGFPSPSPRKEIFEKSRRDSRTSPSPTSNSSPRHSRSLSSTSRIKATATSGRPLASPLGSPLSPSRSPPAPDYLSPIHRPSTNPTFDFDTKSEFGSWTDFSAVKLKVGLWAKVGSERSKNSVNGKGIEMEHSLPKNQDSSEWQVLEEWNIDLNKMKSLPSPTLNDEMTSHHQQLPSNTLIVTLNPPGRTFYAYAPSLSRPSPVNGRSPSPTPGYSSDPESTVPKDKIQNLPSRRRRQRGRLGQENGKEDEVSRTAGWKDLFKLITIWSTIKDNERSLEEIVHGLDEFIMDDHISPLKREISERECRIAELRAENANVLNKAQELRDEIRIRRELLRERRMMLAQVGQQEDDRQQEREELEEDVLDERARLESLRSLFVPARTTLISTLAYLFPIELRSPPDLLFTILDVPLPIPLSPNDPAPPLSLPAHNDVNEDNVASALGYVAFVVQLLAAYLGYVLPYSITYIGSRSLIRDGISAMIGPRMFPLFSKGVDKYRFEYGVFLLNKDIETLMVEQDLRATDIRHSLPNLKNLLLTLTNGEGVPIGSAQRASSPLSHVSGLESPPSESSRATPETTPKANEVVNLPPETTPPTSGPSTGTAPVSMDTFKKTSRFLGLSPLAGFLRVRYPSSLLSRNNDEILASADVQNGEELSAAAGSSSDDAINTEHSNGVLVKQDGLGLGRVKLQSEDSGVQGEATEVFDRVVEAQESSATSEVDTDSQSLRL